MDYMKRLEIAEEILRDSFGYDGGDHTENLSFVLNRLRSGGIEARNKSGGAFYWALAVIKAANAVGLGVYCDAEIVDGEPHVRMIIC